MNREIKFRAWDKNRNRFLENGEMLLGNIIAWKNNKEFSVGYTGDYELMQFTGLKDKQSKEIYEGDIMSSEMGNGRITWVECSGKFVLEGDNFLINPWDGYEVIGNVFENKYLLTK